MNQTTAVVSGFLSMLFGATACGDDPVAGPYDLIMPEEISDTDALGRLASLAELPLVGDGIYRQQSSYQRPDREDFDLPLLENGNTDFNNFVCISDDADLRYPILAEPYSDLDACPEDYVRGFVMGRFEGSGRLARFHMTTLSLFEERAQDVMVRFYVDDRRSPVIQAPLTALVDGSAGPLFQPPFGADANTHLAWYYPLVFADKLIIAVDHLPGPEFVYYQIGVVLDSEPMERSASSEPLSEREAVIGELERRVGQPISGTTELVGATEVSIPAGEERTLVDLDGPGTILELTLVVDEADLALLDQIDIAATWDGAIDPAIALAASELYVAALAPPEPSSAVLGSAQASGTVALSLRLPAPFADRAVITASNRHTDAVSLTVSARGLDSAPAGSYGQLRAVSSSTLGTTDGPNHAIADIAGRGRYVGTCLMMEGHGLDLGSVSQGHNFLEGDFRGRIDGEDRIVGTGTEDYLNSAFYFEDGPFATAFAQGWDIVADDNVYPPTGRASSCRWHVFGDAIDFASSFSLEVEIGPAAPELLDRYRSTAFWYQ